METAMRLISGLLILGCLVASTPAFACGPEVRIQFAEDSPDRFRIEFVRGPKQQVTSLQVNLNGSAAGVIFDDYDGLGAQGPQPGPSGVTIRSVTYRASGAETVALTFEGFTEQRIVDFNSDLDDHGRAGDPDQNHINEGELTGATAQATLLSTNGRHIVISGQFDKLGHARLGDRACV